MFISQETMLQVVVNLLAFCCEKASSLYPNSFTQLEVGADM
jgi:hypothetical protein